MSDKFIAVVNGNMQEKSFSIVSTGAADAGKGVGLDAGGKLDITLLPTGVGPEVTTLLTTEALTAGQFVNIFNSAGVAKVRKADATTAGKEANGFVLNSYSVGEAAIVYSASQTNNQLSGLTPGSVYFLSTTTGSVTDIAPSASGNIVQKLGRASSSTTITFTPYDPITLA